MTDSTTTHITKCSGCGCPLHSSTTTGVCSETCAREASHLAHARYLGADAALSTNTWIEMSESDARSILSDVDPEVMDRYPEPNLSGEWADDPTPSTLAYEILGTRDVDPDVENALSDAWEEGRDEVWSDALQATALRVLGDLQAACELERDIENRVDALRIKAERASEHPDDCTCSEHRCGGCGYNERTGCNCLV